MEPDSEFSFVGRWPQIEALLGGAGQIDALARATGALKRPREVRDGSQLLRLALGYAATGRSLRTTAAWSASALGVELSDVALLGRLYETGDFLASLTTGLLARLCRVAAPSETWQGPPIRLVDGSMFAGPGRKGGQHRLHASYDPARQMFTTFDLTSHKQGESLSRGGIEPGAIALGDRNYAKTRSLRQAEEAGAFYLLRTGLRSMRMIDPRTGDRLTGEAVLAALGEGSGTELAVEMIEVTAGKADIPAPVKARLVILRASDAATTREQARIERSRTKHKATPTKDTQALAGVVMLITNLPPTPWPIDKLALLYRLRWQIELAFKTLKSTFAMRHTPAKDPRLARTWILANLVAALLTELLLRAIERAIPPSAPQPCPAGAKTPPPRHLPRRHPRKPARKPPGLRHRRYPPRHPQRPLRATKKTTKLHRYLPWPTILAPMGWKPALRSKQSVGTPFVWEGDRPGVARSEQRAYRPIRPRSSATSRSKGLITVRPPSSRPSCMSSESRKRAPAAREAAQITASQTWKR